MASFAAMSDSNFFPDPNENIMDSLFQQYERVIVESLITSFGLDFLVKDRHGGDVDTIHNVRQVKDGAMEYKNAANKAAYDSRGAYNSVEYHRDPAYLAKRKEYASQKQANSLYDGYTGKKFDPDDKVDTEHIISAKEIHEDPGRVLAGLKGTDLANSDDNLCAASAHTNRSKRDDTMDEFLKRQGSEYTESQQQNMKEVDKKARKAYEMKLAASYYTSSRFAADTAKAAGTVGLQMGIRQAVGLIFTEIWFSVKEEFSRIPVPFQMNDFLISIGNGIQRGFVNAKDKYKAILSKFQSGAVSGILSSVTTTLCNIFFTTAKNIVRIIRQSYASLVEAAKILFLNPDNLPFGERMRATAKIIATGASVVIGTIVSDAIGNTGIKAVPVLCDIVPTFCGTLATGILTCSLLYYLDRSNFMNRLVSSLNSVPSISTEVDYFKRQAALFERYAAKLMEIDLNQFINETKIYSTLAHELERTDTNAALNQLLKKAVLSIGIEIPWGDDFNSFMNDKTQTLRFE